MPEIIVIFRGVLCRWCGVSGQSVRIEWRSNEVSLTDERNQIFRAALLATHASIGLASQW